MFNRIKRELEEINDAAAHMAEQPVISTDNNKNLTQLINLSQRINSKFKVSGTADDFVIKTPSNNGILIFVSLLFLCVSSIGVVKSQSLYFWLIVIGLFLTTIYLIIKFGTANDLNVDSMAKVMNIKNNNFIGRYIRPITTISFSEVKDITFVNINIGDSGGGTRGNYNRVFINDLNGKKWPIIDLLDGPVYFINHKIFIGCLRQIIQNGQ